jgi:hypothetical protein
MARKTTGPIEIHIYQVGLSNNKQPRWYPSTEKYIEGYQPEGWAYIGLQLVEIPLPDDYDPVQVTISALKAQQAQAEKDFREETSTRMTQINNLLALEMSPSSTVEFEDDTIPF